MRAVVVKRYGSPEVALELKEVDRPGLTADGILVRVRAASVNRVDWYRMSGVPFLLRLPFDLRRPRSRLVLGTDFAGTVEAAGKDVTGFRPGDEVFGAAAGTLAEYVSIPASGAVALKPATLTFEAAAAVPLAALTALQGLRDKGQLQPGQKVLINGASGGVGTFAVQIAKALGGEVTAVCSTGNVEMARSLGADRVVDYNREDFTRSDLRYDLIFDNAGSRGWSECKRVLKPQARLVLVGAAKGSRLLGPLGHIVRMRLRSVPSSQKFIFSVTNLNKADMAALRDLLDAGQVRPEVERTFPLSQVSGALRYLGEGHAKGKIVITL
ncbi:MAG: NAD(P)-dependent alcohol dehydrogenase [Chloroflexi bacterium]|nr:NAD(P)-dependent alcohol dehydrogenase [Chloroflexota bacterium]